MRNTRDTHDLTPQSDGQDFRTVEPRRTVDQTKVAECEEVDSENGEALSDSVVGELELSLHDGCVDLDDDDAEETPEEHTR